MSDAKRTLLELRAIEVSTRAALRHVMTVDELERVRTTSSELLARLQQTVIRDGGEPDLLAAIERARRTLWESA